MRYSVFDRIRILHRRMKSEGAYDNKTLQKMEQISK